MPVTVLAFVVAGVALMGVVPSGAYLAKKLLLDAADQSGQWWWTIVLQGGAAFTAGYVVLVLVSALRRPAEPLCREARRALVGTGGAGAGRVVAAARASRRSGRCPAISVSNPLAPKEIGTTLLVLLGGARWRSRWRAAAWPDRRVPALCRGESDQTPADAVGTAFEGPTLTCAAGRRRASVW
jgi:multicomponent Na+:H+ antiporter subunit D